MTLGDKFRHSAKNQGEKLAEVRKGLTVTVQELEAKWMSDLARLSTECRSDTFSINNRLHHVVSSMESLESNVRVATQAAVNTGIAPLGEQLPRQSETLTCRPPLNSAAKS